MSTITETLFKIIGYIHPIEYMCSSLNVLSIHTYWYKKIFCELLFTEYTGIADRILLIYIWVVLTFCSNNIFLLWWTFLYICRAVFAGYSSLEVFAGYIMLMNISFKIYCTTALQNGCTNFHSHLILNYLGYYYSFLSFSLDWGGDESVIYFLF